MNGKLLIRPRPEPEESLLGLLLRAAEANGYPDLNWISQLAGARHFSVFDPEPAAAIADLFDLPAHQLATRFYRATGSRNQVNFRDQPVHRSMIDVRYAKLCPVCLAEHTHLRSSWDLTLLPACPDHGVRLIGACPKCARPLNWRRPNVAACACGYDLRGAPATRLSPAAQILARALSFIAALAPVAVIVELPDDFLQLPLGEALDLTLFLGSHLVGRGAGRGRRLAPRLRLSDAVTVFEAAAQVLTEWPKNFYLMLDDIRRHAAVVSTRTGLQGEFRSFYAALYPRARGEPDGSGFVRRAFENYVENHWDGGFVSRKNTRLGDTAYADRRYVTRAEAMKLLRMRGPVIDRLIAHKRLVATHRRMRQRTLTLVDRRSVDAFQLGAAELVGLGQAKAILGLSKVPVLDLAAHGHLNAERGPRVDGSSTWMFRRSALDQFVDTVVGPPPFGTSQVLENRCDFEAALRRVSWHGLHATDLVKEILAGQLKVIDHDRTQVGLRVAQFYRSDVDALIERHQPAGTDWVSLTVAARELGLKEQVAYELAQRSLLRTWPRTHNGKPQLGVPRAAVDEFKKTYVAAADLAARHHTSARHVVVSLERSGIRPATGPTVDQSRQYFFHRARLGAPDAAQVLDELGIA